MSIIKVKTGGITADAITDALIADDVVGTEHLTANEVDTTALGADAVTGAQLADDAVNSEHYTDGSVDTAHIADAQITTAKLSTAVLTGATDIGADLADADLFLVDDGAGGTLRKTAASRIKTYVGSPGMTLLTSGSTTSTTSTIGITGTHVTSAHDHYRMYVAGKAEADNIAFHMRFRNAANNGHIESGYTWKITAHGADSDTANNTNDDKIRLTNQTYLGANTNEGFNMIIDFMSPNSTTVPTMAFWKISGSSQSDTLAVQEGGSRRNDGTEAHTGFLLFFDSGGDFDSFNYQFYGLDKS